jgi:hypothetical protein
MKHLVATTFALLLLCHSFANTYYSTNNANPNTTSSWHSNRNGSGSTPSNFSGNGDIFVVQAGHTMTTTANWAIGGNNSKIIIESGARLQADHKITVDIIEAYDGGSYIHNDNSAAFPGNNDRIFAPGSTVTIQNWSGSAKLPAPTTWGNLIIDMPAYTSHINQAGTLTDIAGDFIIRSTGSGKEFRLATNQDFTLNIGGNLIIEGGILQVSSSNGNASQVININGSFIQSGGTFTRSNNNSNVVQVRFNGTNSGFTQSGGTITNTYMSFVVNAGKKLTLNNDLAIAASRSMQVDGTLNLGNSHVTGAGAFSLGGSASLITSLGTGLAGSLATTGAVNLANGASYEFLSATSTPFPASVSSVSASNFTANADITINKNVTIAGALTLNNCKVTIPAGNTLTVSSGNAIAGSNLGASSYVVTQVNSSTGAKGMLRLQNLTGNKSVPVGTGTYYLPVTLVSSGVNDFSICVFNGVTVNGEPNGTAFTATQKKSIVDAVWQVNRNSGSADVMMTLGWPNSLEGTSFAALAGNQVGISHFGTYWEPAFGSGDQSANTATRSAIVSFSPFGVGLAGSILPLKFGEIRASQKSRDIEIDWFSFSETNLHHYEVERSTDGRNFQSKATVACAGNSTVRKDYSWVDNISTDGIFFYRVKAIDVDSKIVYSQVVRINISQRASLDLILYPNPVVDKRVTLQMVSLPAGQYRVQAVDRNGSVLFQQSFGHGGGAVTRQLQLPNSLLPGIYNLTISGDNETRLSRSFVIQ